MTEDVITGAKAWILQTYLESNPDILKPRAPIDEDERDYFREGLNLGFFELRDNLYYPTDRFIEAKALMAFENWCTDNGFRLSEKGRQEFGLENYKSESKFEDNVLSIFDHISDIEGLLAQDNAIGTEYSPHRYYSAIFGYVAYIKQNLLIFVTNTGFEEKTEQAIRLLVEVIDNE